MAGKNRASNTSPISSRSRKTPVPVASAATAVGDVDTEVIPDIVRFSVHLARDSAEALKATAARKGITVTDAFRRAIAIAEVIDEEIDSGNKLVSIDAEGDRTRLVFR